MDADEREVFDYLHSFGEDWVHAKEVCRRAGGKRRYHEDNYWAIPVLKRLQERQEVEADITGRYRIKPKKEDRRKLSPEAIKALRESGIRVDEDRADFADGDSGAP